MPCHVLEGWLWPKPSGTWPCAPLGTAGPSPTRPARGRRAWSGASPSPPLMVLEATGGLERAVPSALAAAGLPGGVVHPRQARDVARATGQVATTEAWAARALAHVAEGLRPPPRPRPAAQPQERRALVGRRQPRLIMRTAEQHRVAGTSERLPKAMLAHLTWRTTALAPLAHDLATTLRASPRWRDHDALWQRAQGIGPGWARTVRRERPALGTCTRQHSAACVGVAPRHGDRGPRRGRRTLWGGRAPVRTVFDLGPLVATRDHPQITAFSARLLAAGNGKKVALTACMPKLWTLLQALLTPRTPWQPQEVQN